MKCIEYIKTSMRNLNEIDCFKLKFVIEITQNWNQKKETFRIKRKGFYQSN